MDELDEFWTIHFGRPASPIERRLIAAFDRTVGADDPMFPIIMMQVCTLYETLGSIEKAVLEHGPALQEQMMNLNERMDQLSGDLTAVTAKLSTISTVSTKLLITQQKLLNKRDLELRIATLPDWIKGLLVAAVTAVVMALGGGLLVALRG